MYALVFIGVVLMAAAILYGFARTHKGKQVAIGLVAVAMIANAATTFIAS